jgi:arabinan endo-1,5-alpha-L-arabinosidase
MVNPIIAENCPDPAVFHDHELSPNFYLACTTDWNDQPDKFPLWCSRDLLHWEPSGFIFPSGRLPGWAASDFWAPEIHRIGEHYVCYFTARDQTGRLCIGVAHAEHPKGPWVDLGRPFLRNERVGLIDAHFLRDHDGRQYLYWKADGNDLRPRKPTPIFVQELDSEGMGLLGDAREVLTNDRAWEASVVEGPWVARRGEHYYLFYSGNAYRSTKYATGVARSRSPVGPFEKKAEPILSSNRDWKGPGHGCLVQRDGADYFVHHAWQAGRVSGRHPRMALVSRVSWNDDWPLIHIDGRSLVGCVDASPGQAQSAAQEIVRREQL